MAWQELSVSGVLRGELRGQHLHLQQCELPWTQFRWTAVKFIAAFWAQMKMCQIFLQETSTTESSHKNGILISSQLPAPIATSLVIDVLLTQSSAFSPFQLITAILWQFIHLEKGWQWTWLGICCFLTVVVMMMVMVEKCWELVFFFKLNIFIQLDVADIELSDGLGVGSRAVLRICACLSDSSASRISTPLWRYVVFICFCNWWAEAKNGGSLAYTGDYHYTTLLYGDCNASHYIQGFLSANQHDR